MKERIEKALGESLALFFSKNATLNPATFAINCPPEVFENFAKVLLLDCIENLEFHGHEDAISQLRWHAQSKYGIILD
jgi:hypothetical protein